MDSDTIVETAPSAVEEPASAAVETDLVSSDLLIEDVSIDGMCGVY